MLPENCYITPKLLPENCYIRTIGRKTSRRSNNPVLS